MSFCVAKDTFHFKVFVFVDIVDMAETHIFCSSFEKEVLFPYFMGNDMLIHPFAEGSSLGLTDIEQSFFTSEHSGDGIYARAVIYA